MKTKYCPDCKRRRDTSQFNKHPRNRDGLQTYCKKHAAKRARESHKRDYAKNPEKYKKRMRDWLLANPEKAKQQRHNRRMSQYGITTEDYELLVAAAAGRCQICRQPAKLHIDHDHTTGKVRGLLCGLCNRGLGKFGDNVLVLQAAIAYLQKH